MTVPSSLSAHINLRLLHPLARYLREHLGDGALSEVAAAVGRDPRDFEGRSIWISTEELEHILAAARERLEGDDELVRACAHRMPEEYGPLRFVVQATTPFHLFRQAARNFHLISRVGKLRVERVGANHIRVHYSSSEPEGRLSCLSRQAQMAAAPTLWGLPPAVLEEHGCVARGDPECVYELRVYQSWRWLPILLGAAVGSALGAMLLFSSLGLPSSLVGALCGGLFGYALELRRSHRANLAMGNDAIDALRELSHEEAEARLEIVGLHDRQRRWLGLIEQQLRERSSSMNEMVDQVRRAGEDRTRALRGMSHDLRNPLMVLMTGITVLEQGGADRSVTEPMYESIERMTRLLEDMVGRLGADLDVSWTHESLDVAALPAKLSARMRALVFGRDVHVEVSHLPGAPSTIRCDPMLFDRVVDNLFTNAAKYTESGSVEIVIGGTPERLTVEVSDTGRGIAPDELERIFEPGGSRQSSRKSGSLGVGLSVVVDLLAGIGGSLEVMSEPTVGTSFSAHFPVEPSTRSAHPPS